MDASTKIGLTLETNNETILLTQVLGHGSFAIVYKGESKSTQYAIKTLFKKNLTEKQLKIQKLEAQFQQRVSDHPNIVTLHNIIEDDECLYLVLDYYHAGDLFDALVGSNDLLCSSLSDPHTSLQLFLGIVSAIRYCHSKGVYHRDLKPENILLRRNIKNNGWEFGLADFGLATEAVFSRDFACGSLRYMSPECYNDQNKYKGYSTAANDVWGLGIILINLLTQKNPWCEPSCLDPMFEEWSNGNADDLFINQFNFSNPVDILVRGCFELDWRKRISINQLYNGIKKIIDNRLDIIYEFDDEFEEEASSVVPNQDLVDPIENVSNNVLKNINCSSSSINEEQDLKPVLFETTKETVQNQLYIVALPAESSSINNLLPTSSESTTLPSNKKRSNLSKPKPANIQLPTTPTNTPIPTTDSKYLHQSTHEQIVNTLQWVVSKLMLQTSTTSSSTPSNGNGCTRVVSNEIVGEQQRAFGFIVVNLH